MSDELMRIKELRDELRRFVNERDWSKYHHPKELAISITLMRLWDVISNTVDILHINI